VKEDTSLLTDDDDDDDMEDLDALAKGLDQGTPAASPKPASAPDTGHTPIWISFIIGTAGQNDGHLKLCLDHQTTIGIPRFWVFVEGLEPSLVLNNPE